MNTISKGTLNKSKATLGRFGGFIKYVQLSMKSSAKISKAGFLHFWKSFKIKLSQFNAPVKHMNAIFDRSPRQTEVGLSISSPSVNLKTTELSCGEIPCHRGSSI